MTTADSDARFDAVDWSEVDSRRLPRPRTLAFLAALAALVGVFLYDYRVVDVYLVARWEWDVTRVDWLFMLSVVVFAFYVVVPLATNRRWTARVWGRLRRRPPAVAAFAYLVVFAVLGALGPFLVGTPELAPSMRLQPPLGFSIGSQYVVGCAAGEVASFGACPGSLQFPLGTDRIGRGVVTLVVFGMRVSLFVAAIATMLIVPIGVAVGTVAGYAGGWTDELLMRYVDVQQTVPAFLVYLVLMIVLEKSLFLLVLVFGLLSWGGVARLVRSEVLGRREAGYVRAAESAGAGRLHVVRRHLLPNVSNAVVTAVSRQVPALILAEAAVAFLGLNETSLPSWGETISNGIAPDFAPWPVKWWVSTFPVLFLAVTVVSFAVFGDALRDALDPRGGR